MPEIHVLLTKKALVKIGAITFGCSPPILRDFKAKVEDHRCSSGILLSKNGITGEGVKDAMGEIRDAYKIKGISILVVTEIDLEEISKGKNIISLLEKKYEEVKFM